MMTISKKELRKETFFVVKQWMCNSFGILMCLSILFVYFESDDVDTGTAYVSAIGLLLLTYILSCVVLTNVLKLRPSPLLVILFLIVGLVPGLALLLRDVYSFSELTQASIPSAQILDYLGWKQFALLTSTSVFTTSFGGPMYQKKDKKKQKGAKDSARSVTPPPLPKKEPSSGLSEVQIAIANLFARLLHNAQSLDTARLEARMNCILDDVYPSMFPEQALSCSMGNLTLESCKSIFGGDGISDSIHCIYVEGRDDKESLLGIIGNMIYAIEEGGGWFDEDRELIDEVILGFGTTAEEFKSYINASRASQERQEDAVNDSSDLDEDKDTYYANILGIKGVVTKGKVQSAYKEKVHQNHPDKVSQMGPAIQETAKQEMQKLNEDRNHFFSNGVI